MKQKLIFGIAFLLFLSLLSCESDEPSDGKWDDNIKLSTKEVNFNADSNSVIITTEGTWWWINGIRLNDDGGYNIKGVDTTQDNFLIEATEFTIERRNANEIHISMTKNQSDKKRILIIGLQAGDYFDSIKIVQSGS